MTRGNESAERGRGGEREGEGIVGYYPGNGTKDDRRVEPVASNVG